MSTSGTLWVVIGGGNSGGIVVREGVDVTSAVAPERVSTGALLEELDLASERLRFKLLSGSGPESGWVSTKLQSGKDLVVKAAGVWQVVGGRDKGGIVVRCGQDTSSEVAATRLSTGSLVRAKEAHGERLLYERLNGSGPDAGWISTRLDTGKELLVRVEIQEFLTLLLDHHERAKWKSISMFETLSCNQEWLAVARPALRECRKNASAKVRRKAQRLFGWLGDAAAVAEGLEDSDHSHRCDAARLLGTIAESGGGAAKVAPFAEKLGERLAQDPEWRVRHWAALALRSLGEEARPAMGALREAARGGHVDVRGAARLALVELGEVAQGVGSGPEEEPTEASLLPAAAPPPPGRNLRVLAVHGAASNSTIMKMQCAVLKRTLGKGATWTFCDSPNVWHPIRGSEDPLFKEPSDMEKQLVKDKPFLWWYSHGNDTYGQVDEGVANLLRFIEESEPDVVVSFSQGSNCVSMLLDRLRREGRRAPWRLSVMFTGGQIDDHVYRFREGWRSPQPTVRVFNAARDDFFGDGEMSLAGMYSDITEIPSPDGHLFPATEPRASEIYAQVTEAIRRRCGVSA